MDSHSARVPLPKNWPQNVKMAVLHVISLAHFAIVHARSIVVNSPNAGTRRAGDLEGSLDEISLLDEELRIKDARMAMIDPLRRPHYRPIERMAILELKAARGWSQAETARRFLVKPTTVVLPENSILAEMDVSSGARVQRIWIPVFRQLRLDTRQESQPFDRLEQSLFLCSEPRALDRADFPDPMQVRQQRNHYTKTDSALALQRRIGSSESMR